MDRFVLLVNGPICAGKSTLADLLLARHKNVFFISGDKIKWLISDYSFETHRGLVCELLLVLAKTMLQKGFSLLIDGNQQIYKGGWNDYAALANEHGVRFFEINLEAPIEVLETRFHARVADAATTPGRKISVKTVEAMMERYRVYQEFKKQDIPTFDTSTLGTEEIVAAVETLIK